MKKHILSVDDEQDIRELLQESLGMRGYRVSTAATPDEARKIAKADRPDLIILDFQIEESDGFVLIDEFRKLYPNIPLMLLTGAVFGKGAVREVIEKKVASYLDKTASLSQIMDEIHRLIGDPEAGGAKN
ncbi:MAG: response regulator [Verrucomicrobiota bacterium]|jgi:two-component system response regulator HydG